MSAALHLIEMVSAVVVGVAVVMIVCACIAVYLEIKDERQ